jgi:tryptophan synthase alpha subunit
VIELGMPFTDPMADGPAIQAWRLARAEGRPELIKTLKMVVGFRAGRQRPRRSC